MKNSLETDFDKVQEKELFKQERLEQETKDHI